MQLFCLQMEEFKISFGCLNRGQLYPIVSAEKTVSEFYGKKSNGIKVKIVDEDDLELTTWLPKKLVDSVDDTQFEDIVKAGKSESPDSKFKVCYYGKVESAKTTIFVGRIHKPNEGIFYFLS